MGERENNPFYRYFISLQVKNCEMRFSGDNFYFAWAWPT